jgi:serpin B
MEKNNLAACICFVMVLVVLAGCATTKTASIPQQTSSITPSLPPGGSSVVMANNLFTYDMLTRISKDPASAGSNIFFSPFSVSSALAITYEGARGTTADEIRSVFHFPSDLTALRQGYSDLNAGINNGQESNYTLRTANALWAEKTFTFLPEYATAAQRYYGANITNLDFINNPEGSRQIINQWIDEKTADKIQNLIPSGAIDPSTRLVITNAIYFKGSWAWRFDNNMTKPANFYVTPDKPLQVPMMQQIDSSTRFGYAETSDLQVLEMPYSHGIGHELSMLIFLPKNGSLSAAETALSPDNLTEIRNDMVFQEVRVSIPKFTLHTEYQLNGILSAMGMPTAFSGSADFSGMDGAKDLYVSDVVHKAYVDVNEEGTEAAAATGVVMWASAIQNPQSIPVFKADHPFVFLIQDNDSGAVLFVGKIANPIG